VNTLLSINGSMKEFSEDIEDRFAKAFNSMAGKKYGMTEGQLRMRRANSKATFGALRESTADVNA